MGIADCDRSKYIRQRTDGNLDDMMEYIEIFPVPLTESLGTVTGKYRPRIKSPHPP
jgi:serine protein kinase